MGKIQLPNKVDVQGTLDAIEKRLCESSLHEFIKRAWHVVEPGQKFIDNWHIPFITEHLEAITDNHVLEGGSPYNRLLINVPPGFSKSIILNVFWPAWEWGPCNQPHHRYICAAHQQGLAIRDSTKMRRLITSDWYQKHWGDRVQLTGDQNAKTKFENTATGFREAIAAGSITGSRGTRVLVDDPNSVEGANSDAMRASTNEWFTEAVPTRLNDPKQSAIVVIMQRLHEEDVSGVILERKGFRGTYDHICLPMRYEKWRDGQKTWLGYDDPRTEEGELLFPDRFPIEVVDDLEGKLGPYATAGQHQQAPTPRGGGVIKDAWWQPWEAEEFPDLDYIVASLDTAYSTKADERGDYSAMTIWGVFSGDPKTRSTRVVDRYGKKVEDGVTVPYSDDLDAVPKIILMYAWAERLDLHELVTKVNKDCKKHKVDKILVENKAAGHSVAQELRRLFSQEDYFVQLYDPKSIDKLGRLYSVQHIFSEGMVHAPDKEWAEQVIRQVATFPRGKHDDLCLVGDTLISMGDGSTKSLQDVVIGDSVMTPNGAQLVSASSFTGVKPTWRLEYNGRAIEGTANHPIFANGEWKELASLCPSDTLTLCPASEVQSWVSKAKAKLLSKVSSSTVANTIATQIQKILPIVGILLAPVRDCIATYGSFIKGKFQRGIKSIILMKIPAITTFPTLNVCRAGIIEPNTMPITLPEVDLSNNLLIWQESTIWQKLGIKAKRAANGIVKTLMLRFTAQIPLSRIAKAITPVFANGVAQLLRLKVLKNLCVQHLASNKNQSTCVVEAVTFTRTMRPVYNLTVEGEGCYYANGILVHNCDTVSMALRHLRDIGLLTRSQERLSEINQDKQHRGKPPVPLYGV